MSGLKFMGLETIILILIIFSFALVTSQVLADFGIPVSVSFNGYKIILISDVLPTVSLQSRIIVLGLTVFAIFGMVYCGRRSVAFIFIVSNLAMLFLCLILDFFAYKEIDTWGSIASGAINFFMVVIYISIMFFSMFIRWSVINLLRLCLCGALSYFWLFLSVIVLSVISTGFSGASLAFFFYAVLAYGVFGLHIWSLSWLLGSAELVGHFYGHQKARELP
ncbi:MAG: hypothetical protein OEN23_13935 [Paracoccaceae bacterium]|nr:hypothetical protein [Paracoccaceae bacterium]